MNYDALIREIKSDEGFRPHAYRDTEGFLTIGYGFLVDPQRGGGLPENIAEAWLEQIVNAIIREVEKALPNFYDHPETVRRALVNMAYQMGVPGLLRFRKTLDFLNQGQYGAAGREALNSKWAEQTPERAARVANMIVDGLYAEGENANPAGPGIVREKQIKC